MRYDDYEGIHFRYDDGNWFAFSYKHLSLFDLSDVLVNKSMIDRYGILDLDEHNRLKIGVDEC
jgi:hypothetical protein